MVVRSRCVPDGGYGALFFVRDFIVLFVIVLLSPRNIFDVRVEGKWRWRGMEGRVDDVVDEEIFFLIFIFFLLTVQEFFFSVEERRCPKGVVALRREEEKACLLPLPHTSRLNI